MLEFERVNRFYRRLLYGGESLSGYKEEYIESREVRLYFSKMNEIGFVRV